MKTICLYFQVHQPFRFRRYRFFDIGESHYYYDDYSNESIMKKVAGRCYLPANQLMLDLIEKYGERIRVAWSVSGIALDQFELYAPEVLESFRRLAATGQVEFLAETYSHSLVSLADPDEFRLQVKEHSDRIESLFGVRPGVFRNTELVYSDDIGAMIADMGYGAMLTEGAKHILGWKSPNYLYYNAVNPRLKLLLKNYKLSDDIAFRFSDRGWGEWPLTAEKYAGWLRDIGKKEEVINLFMDYETFGEHQDAETGIFEFLRTLPGELLRHNEFRFATPSEVASLHEPVAPMHVPYPISWADEERDLSAWLGNDMQNEAFTKLYELRELVKKTNDPKIMTDWRYLQVSDHFYYMSTKFFSDGEVHKYFNPYESPYDAFINYMNVLSDFARRVNELVGVTETETTMLKRQIREKEEHLEKLQAEISELREKRKLVATPVVESEEEVSEAKVAPGSKNAAKAPKSPAGLKGAAKAPKSPAGSRTSAKASKSSTETKSSAKASKPSTETKSSAKASKRSTGTGSAGKAKSAGRKKAEPGEKKPRGRKKS
ncbi:MAG: alpha-amylase [Marinilabiliales bacterium]|nr:MAG: alpha-amylase [Marinilabiliales bacterium]